MNIDNIPMQIRTDQLVHFSANHRETTHIPSIETWCILNHAGCPAQASRVHLTALMAAPCAGAPPRRLQWKHINCINMRVWAASTLQKIGASNPHELATALAATTCKIHGGGPGVGCGCIWVTYESVLERLGLPWVPPGKCNE